MCPLIMNSQTFLFFLTLLFKRLKLDHEIHN